MLPQAARPSAPRVTQRVRQAKTMVADVLDLLEALGRFGAFWGFMLSGSVRKRVQADWRKAGVAGRCLMVLEGVLNTFVGLLPLWIVLAVAWWR